MAEYLDDKTMRVSHETIYKSLFIQARGVLKKRADIASTQQADHAPLENIYHARTDARSNR
jgi:IS30 family transposase